MERNGCDSGALYAPPAPASGSATAASARRSGRASTAESGRTASLRDRRPPPATRLVGLPGSKDGVVLTAALRDVRRRWTPGWVPSAERHTRCLRATC